MTVLTPTDVRNAAFRKPPLGRRGYDEDEVDSFLDRVEVSLTALYQEIARLRSELDAARTPDAPRWTSVARTSASELENPEPQPYLPQPYHSHEASPETTLATELDVIKRRLAWIEHVLGTAFDRQTPESPTPT